MALSITAIEYIKDRDEVLVTTRDCYMCEQPAQVRVPADEYAVLTLNKGNIQDVTPSLSPAERETLMSGTHGECWAKMWADDDDDGVELELEDEDGVEGETY
jgi:hypothetical protein